ncbi:hypothetical protein ES708_14478 [subsurface metagenome]
MILLQTAAAVPAGVGGLTPTAQILIAIIPLAAVVMLTGLFFFYLFWDYKKQVFIIEKGGNPPRHRIDEKLLLIGIVSLFVGIGLTIFFAVYTGFTPSLLGGIIPMVSGLGIVVYYIIRRIDGK